MEVPKGRVNYESNSFDGGKPRENPTRGFTSFPEELSDKKIRQRSETFADHYSQARMFFRSMTKPEQTHIVSAFAFELGKVETKAIRTLMLGHLALVDDSLHAGVEDALGIDGLVSRGGGRGKCVAPKSRHSTLPKPCPAMNKRNRS